MANTSVNDEQEATLRAFLAKDFEAYERLSAQLRSSGDWAGYTALVAAGFVEAVDRRFGTQHPEAEVTRVVADARARFAEAGFDFDQAAGERLVMSALGEGAVDDLDDDVVVRAETVLLSALIEGEGLSAEALDEFIAEAGQTAAVFLAT